MAEVEIEVSGRDDFNRAALGLTQAGREIPQRVQKEIKGTAKQLSKEAAAKALTQPALKGKHTGLRRDVAKGVGVVPFEDEDGSGFRIVTSMPESDEAIIPRGLDTSFRRGWRHPVFGDRNRWVRQHGGLSWFMDVMQQSPAILGPKVEDILEDAADHVDKAAGG